MTNIQGALLVFIIISVVALSTIAISASYQTKYQTAINDTTNNTGISNDTYQQVLKPMSKSIIDSTPGAILIGLLIAVLSIVLVVWAVLKRGE